jgi:hypothetical protein
MGGCSAWDNQNQACGERWRDNADYEVGLGSEILYGVVGQKLNSCIRPLERRISAVKLEVVSRDSSCQLILNIAGAGAGIE